MGGFWVGGICISRHLQLVYCDSTAIKCDNSLSQMTSGTGLLSTEWLSNAEDITKCRKASFQVQLWWLGQICLTTTHSKQWAVTMTSSNMTLQTSPLLLLPIFVYYSYGDHSRLVRLQDLPKNLGDCWYKTFYILPVSQPTVSKHSMTRHRTTVRQNWTRLRYRLNRTADLLQISQLTNFPVRNGAKTSDVFCH